MIMVMTMIMRKPDTQRRSVKLSSPRQLTKERTARSRERVENSETVRADLQRESKGNPVRGQYRIFLTHGLLPNQTTAKNLQRDQERNSGWTLDQKVKCKTKHLQRVIDISISSAQTLGWCWKDRDVSMAPGQGWHINTCSGPCNFAFCGSLCLACPRLTHTIVPPTQASFHIFSQYLFWRQHILNLYFNISPSPPPLLHPFDL